MEEHGSAKLIVERFGSIAYFFGRHTTPDFVIRDVFSNHCSCSNNRTFTDSDVGKNDGTRANKDIVFDSDRAKGVLVVVVEIVLIVVDEDLGSDTNMVPYG